MSEARDTHFRGSAEKLWKRLRADPGVSLHWEDRERGQVIIAQYAYDLACHVATHTMLIAYGDMSKIPDLDEFPHSL